MSDLISRQAAIDALGEEPEVWSGKDEYEQGLNNQWHYDVNALKALPSAQLEKAQLSGENATFDCISRQTAIDAIDDIESEVADGDGFQYAKWREYFCDLPSAQPEPLKITIDPPTADELERIKQAMRITPVIFFPSAQPEPSEITDEQAIMHLQSTGWMQNHDREMYESGLRERLADDSDSYDALLPSAQPEIKIDHAPTIEPERKTGRWEMLQIPISPPIYKCSVCGGHALQTVTGCLVNRHLEANLTDFCPNCGADMRGEQNG